VFPGERDVTSSPVDVLVVGAGPTGLTLAAQLAAFGTRVRVIDRQPDQVHESRALAVQPRSLEVLARLGLADALLGRGNPAVRLQMHAGRRSVEIPLFDLGFDDTAYPFLLFVSQADTEDILNQHLEHGGLAVERGVELVRLRQTSDGVTCSLRTRGGRAEEVAARYVVGCDGAHSTVRSRAGVGFRGAAYPQTFVLADLDVDGLDKGAAHVYVSEAGMLFFFPLGHPAPWRMLAMRSGPEAAPGDEAPGLAELDQLADSHTAGMVRLHDPVWCSYFRLQHRHAAAYRSGLVFLAGDAAHVHSPAGAQGMNIGIQDAWNLGWKLALVSNGTARPGLLDTYQTERQPVGRSVVRLTDRAFTLATSANPVIRRARLLLAPRALQLAARAGRARTAALRRVAQLTVCYRQSPCSLEGTPSLRHGPRAGDRLPDAPIVIGRHPATLHEALAPSRFHLLLAGPGHVWPTTATDKGGDSRAAIVDVHRLSRRLEPDALHDIDGRALGRLGVTGPDQVAQWLVRPDGHIAYRAAGSDLTGLHAYLGRWLRSAAP
jgi:2-polyprenyl-6-methoxyphenol hydroxylase-like FAD-dependent oxidoreductase